MHTPRSPAQEARGGTRRRVRLARAPSDFTAGLRSSARIDSSALRSRTTDPYNPCCSAEGGSRGINRVTGVQTHGSAECQPLAVHMELRIRSQRRDGSMWYAHLRDARAEPRATARPRTLNRIGSPNAAAARFREALPIAASGRTQRTGEVPRRAIRRLTIVVDDASN